METFLNQKNIDDLYKKLLDFNQKNFEWLKKPIMQKFISINIFIQKITRELRRYLLDKLVEDS